MAKFRDLTAGQYRALRVMAGDQRHTMLAGGSRSGKTFLLVRATIIRALRASGSKHLITRLHGNALRASIWLDTYPTVMRECFPEIPSVPHRSDGFEELPGGSQIWFGGIDDKDRSEKILGQEYTTIYANEVSQIPYQSILVLRTRLAALAGDMTLRFFYDLNPPSTQHWSYIEFVKKMDPMQPRKKIAHPDQFDYAYLNPEDNRENLSPEYLEELKSLPPAYRARFYEGAFSKSIEGALWTLDLLDSTRTDKIDPRTMDQYDRHEFTRIVTAVDPSGAHSKDDLKSDEVGIVVAGRRKDGSASVLEDATMRGGPEEWGLAAVAAHRRWKGNAIVAEKNFGGAMVESTIRMADRRAPIKLVTASRGKMVRAEPVSLLYSKKQVNHAGVFPELEDQLCNFSIHGYQGSRSPDRADAAIWALSELLVDKTTSYTLANIK